MTPDQEQPAGEWVSVLRGLAANAAALRAFEPEVRAIIGHSNWSAIATYVERADQLLASPQPSSLGADDIVATIALALGRGYTPADILDENSPIRDRIREHVAASPAPTPAEPTYTLAQIADAATYAEVPDSKYESMCIALQGAPTPADAAPPEPFQQRMDHWLLACFGEKIARDKIERNHRFLEEALELVQALGCTADEAHQLVDYTFGRPAGEAAQEVGGVVTTLAALCSAQGIDMNAAAENELARIWTKVEAIRAKQAAKPKHSPLPAKPQQTEQGKREALSEAIEAFERIACRQTTAEHDPLFAIVRKFFAADRARQASPPAAITAKPLEWEQHSRHKEWHDKYHGFYISLDAEEDEPYGACWGEGDTERFATLEEAQRWCQGEIDDWVRRWAVAASPPAAVPVELSDASLLAAMQANPRWHLDCEVLKFGAPGKWRVWELRGNQMHSTSVKTIGEGDTPAAAIDAAILASTTSGKGAAK